MKIKIDGKSVHAYVHVRPDSCRESVGSVFEGDAEMTQGILVMGLLQPCPSQKTREKEYLNCNHSLRYQQKSFLVQGSNPAIFDRAEHPTIQYTLVGHKTQSQARSPVKHFHKC